MDSDVAATAIRMMPASVWQSPAPLRRLGPDVLWGLGHEPPDPAAVNIPIFEHFRRVAGRFPHHLAVDDGRTRLTYGLLLRAALRLAAVMADTPGPGGPVGLLLPNAAYFPAATLGCLAIGRPCIALDVNQPAGRNAEIVRRAGLSALVVEGRAWAEALGPQPGLRTIDAADLLYGLEHDTGQDGSALGVPAPVHHPAFILYTSGSTGRPKGIVNSQYALLQRAFQHVDACRIGPGDCLLPLSSPCTTIAGMRETLTALLTGATLRVVDPRHTGLREIRSTIADARATVCYAVPSLLRALIAAGEDRAPFTTLRVVRVGGEAVLWSDVALLRSVLPEHCAIMAAFSSTESPGAHWFVPRGPGPAVCAEPERTVPLGTMVPGLDFTILGEDGMPVRDGEVGELAVRGRAVALGLWDGERCEPGPMEPDPLDPLSRILRTGDLVALGPDRLLRGMGRADRQVKVRGQRVDPAELEAALLRSPEVLEAVAKVRQAGAANALVAFVTARPGADRDRLAQELAAAVRATLPSASHPAAIHVLDAMPRLPSGKLDGVGLLAIDAQRATRGVEAPAGWGPLAAEPARPGGASRPVVDSIWRRVLGLQAAEPGRSWEDVGGDSLRLLRLVFELEEALGRALPLELFDRRMDVVAMADAIEGTLSRSAGPASGDEGKLTAVLLPGSGGDELSLADLRRDLAHRVRFAPVRYPAWRNMIQPGYGFDDLVDSVCDQIHSVLPAGPIALLGYSFGGLVALGVIDRLRGSGRKVTFLGILDTDVATRRTARPCGFKGVWSWVSNIPARARNGELLDSLLRVVAHYLQTARFRRTSSWFVRQLPCGPRFAVDILMLMHRRADLVRPWLDGHSPDLSGVTVTVFRAEAGNAEALPGLGWERWCQSPRVVAVPGDHRSMLEPPHRQVLAARILSVLTGVQTAAPGPVRRVAAGTGDPFHREQQVQVRFSAAPRPGEPDAAASG